MGRSLGLHTIGSVVVALCGVAAVVTATAAAIIVDLRSILN